MIPELKNGTGWIRVEWSGESEHTHSDKMGRDGSEGDGRLRVGVSGVGGEERRWKMEGEVQAVAFSHARLHITVDNPYTTNTATAFRVIYVLYNITVNLTISLDMLFVKICQHVIVVIRPFFA